MSDPLASAPRPVTSRERLETDEVHLWWSRVGAVGILDGSRGWLSDEERARGERFRRETDAYAYLFRRAFLRRVLARYERCAPRDLAFTAGPHGKPAVAGSALRFNLSRTRGRVLVGLARERELGVDVERADALPREAEELSRLARRVLSAPELLELDARDHSARPAAFLRAWTRKEALLKALGTGLSREPATVSVGLDARAPLAPWSVHEGDFEGQGLDLDAPTGFAASLVVEGGDVRLSIREPF